MTPACYQCQRLISLSITNAEETNAQINQAGDPDKDHSFVNAVDRGGKNKMLNGFINYDSACRKDQRTLYRGGKKFGLAVTVRVIDISWLC